MIWRKLSKISLICTALSACTSSEQQLEWRSYKDIDGKIRQIRFVQEITEFDTANSKIDLNNFRGRAISLFDNKEETIGYLALLRNAQGYIATIFDLAGRSLNPKKTEDIKLLASSKQFDFYEFGQFRLTRARFSAKNTICQDFKSRKGVDLIMITNYYPQNSFTDFYSSLINVNLKAEAHPIEIGYTPSFTGQNKDLQKQIRHLESVQGKKILLANIQEKASLLFNLICK